MKKDYPALLSPRMNKLSFECKTLYSPENFIVFDSAS